MRCEFLTALLNFDALVEVSVSVLGTVVCGLNYSPRCLCTKTETLPGAERHGRALLETCAGVAGTVLRSGSTRVPSNSHGNLPE